METRTRYEVALDSLVVKLKKDRPILGLSVEEALRHPGPANVVWVTAGFAPAA